MLLNLAKTENALASISSAAIKNHVLAACDATREIDHSALKIAYHVAAIKPLLEGNTDGLPTKFTDFASKYLGVKKAQAYNILAVGGQVARVSSSDGKKVVYIDEYTLALTAEKYDPAQDWDAYFNAVKKAKSLGSTQILTICQLQTKLNFDDTDVQGMLQDGSLRANMTIKEFTAAIKGKFNAIETTAEESTEPEESTDDSTSASGEQSNQLDSAPTAEFIQFKLGKNWVNEKLYPELCRYADDAPAIAELIKKINELMTPDPVDDGEDVDEYVE